MSAIYQKTELNKNKNSVISNNIIGDVYGDVYIDNNSLEVNQIDWSLRETGKFDEIKEHQLLVNNPITRTIILNEKIEKIIKYSNLYRCRPTLRIYGCFTSLSTIRQKTDTSDLAQLELNEKANLVKFIKNGFYIKIIISLDTNMIFSQNAYTREQYIQRCKDLYNSLKCFQQYKNFQVVFDDRNMLESEYIVDTLLIAQAPIILFDSNIVGYQVTIFDSDRHIVETEINKFENRFAQLLKQNQITKKTLGANSNIELFNNIYKIREQNWFNKD